MLVRLSEEQVALVMTNEQAKMLRVLLGHSKAVTVFTQMWSALRDEFPTPEYKICEVESMKNLKTYNAFRI